MNAPANARPDRVVVVDDDARIRDLLRRYLTQEGFEVLLAEDAKALNRLLTRETIDLIVLDLMLPGEDGLSICRRLRAANDSHADHHADRQGRRRRPHRRPRGRRRRLPAQAVQPARTAGPHPCRAAPPPGDGGARRAVERPADGQLRSVRVRPLAAPPDQGWRADGADHRRVLDAEGPGAPPAPAVERATSWRNWRAAASSNRSTAAWTCRSRACAR